MWKIAIAFVPAVIKTFSNIKNFNDIYHNLQQQQKNVSLYHLGHWVRIKVGGTPYTVRRKTLNKFSDSILSSIAHDDKISAKKITDILSNPSSVFEHSGPTVSEVQKQQQLEKQQSKTDLLEFQNKKLPSIIKKENNNNNNKSQQQHLEETQLEKDLKKIKNYEHYLNGRVGSSGENDEFDTSINENGEKKFKFEKDHDGFYLIDRDPQYFNVILNFLRTGIVHIPASLDIRCLIADSKFYRLPELEMILNDRIIDDKRELEKQEVFKSEFNLNNFVNSKSIDNQIQFIIPMDWFVDWKKFIDGGNPPTPAIVTTEFFKKIDNVSINCLKEGLVLDIDYICVSKETWLIFNKYYKVVGPIIMRQSRNIYDNPPSQFISSTIWNIK